MARMHTGKHGKAKSRKPDVEIGTRPEGLTLSDAEITKLIVGYAKQGMHQAQIGQALKEKHNVPYIKQVYKRRLNVILKENGFRSDLPQDLLDLLRRAVTLRSHLEKNHKDVHNKTSLSRVEAKIWRLSNYYKRESVLPSDWKYDPAKVALIIKS
ncbi:MAG: 30S ribosomal protein S15 [Candidatus Micrarchaeota archaeon]|nr:30S ribosomal protein S15 [Candidatus Micrarchaeota archaeon]MDE1859169.1 30S ribosomal protein S15 [Candidatus Micrarchaeota archaeon]